MNISNGHNGAQGHALPKNTIAVLLRMGCQRTVSESWTAPERPATCCSFSFLNTLAGRNSGCRLCAGVAALMEYLRADLTDIAHSCALIEGGAK